ncbi:hypothetical protein NPIL_680411 [Nephila pilipes]|uniref:Uncharacterized protein n=1 Tax=Nephila pilipes TaxID=299642 RepID=A0A8X6TLM1_NEPPI|nr:hypothetical protein NPIL_680411 [Nephila pilipes]
MSRSYASHFCKDQVPSWRTLEIDFGELSLQADWINCSTWIPKKKPSNLQKDRYRQTTTSLPERKEEKTLPSNHQTFLVRSYSPENSNITTSVRHQIPDSAV